MSGSTGTNGQVTTPDPILYPNIENTNDKTIQVLEHLEYELQMFIFCFTKIKSFSDLDNGQQPNHNYEPDVYRNSFLLHLRNLIECLFYNRNDNTCIRYNIGNSSFIVHKEEKWTDIYDSISQHISHMTTHRISILEKRNRNWNFKAYFIAIKKFVCSKIFQQKLSVYYYCCSEYTIDVSKYIEHFNKIYKRITVKFKNVK